LSFYLAAVGTGAVVEDIGKSLALRAMLSIDFYRDRIKKKHDQNYPMARGVLSRCGFIFGGRKVHFRGP
jgi:hypothetical protein